MKVKYLNTGLFYCTLLPIYLVTGSLLNTMLGHWWMPLNFLLQMCETQSKTLQFYLCSNICCLTLLLSQLQDCYLHFFFTSTHISKIKQVNLHLCKTRKMESETGPGFFFWFVCFCFVFWLKKNNSSRHKEQTITYAYNHAYATHRAIYSLSPPL